jgi:hypothetical protein
LAGGPALRWPAICPAAAAARYPVPVSVSVAEVVRGLDGRLYPARQLPAGELARIRRLEHALHCRDGLSIRATRQSLSESYGIRRSVGSISQDLTRWSCGLPRCLSVPAGG